MVLLEAGYTEEPSDDTKYYMNMAIMAYRDWEIFEHAFPHAGGFRDQPINWSRPFRLMREVLREVEVERTIRREKKRPKDIPED